MANQHTSLFFPEEHRIIADWLEGEPAETLPQVMHILWHPSWLLG